MEIQGPKGDTGVSQNWSQVSLTTLSKAIPVKGLSFNYLIAMLSTFLFCRIWYLQIFFKVISWLRIQLGWPCLHEDVGFIYYCKRTNKLAFRNLSWSFFYIYIYIYLFLFIFGCVGSSLLCAGFLWLWRAGATLCCCARASHCGGLSCCGAWALGAQASVVVACGLSSCGSWALERRLSSCGAWAQPLCSMWDLPRPGLEPVSPALAGRFPTTAPPGKLCLDLICVSFTQSLNTPGS